MKDSVTVRGDSHVMRSVLHPREEKKVRFENQDDKVHDRPTPRYYQQRTPPPPHLQDIAKMESDQLVSNETIPIRMAEGKNRFQVGAFLDTPVTVPIRQLLDRSPQLKVQLACAIASSHPTKREKKSTEPNSVETAEAASKFWTLPVIETVAHEDEEIICLYIDSCIEEKKISKTLVDSGAVVELISRKVVQDLNLLVYYMDKKWTLELVGYGYATLQEYVWITVNVSGVQALVQTFILGNRQAYDLLLSKRWMYKIQQLRVMDPEL